MLWRTLTSSVTMISGYLSSDRKLKMHQILKASSLEMNSWLWSRFFLEHNVQHILLKSWRSKLSITCGRAEQHQVSHMFVFDTEEEHLLFLGRLKSLERVKIKPLSWKTSPVQTFLAYNSLKWRSWASYFYKLWAEEWSSVLGLFHLNSFLKMIFISQSTAERWKREGGFELGMWLWLGVACLRPLCYHEGHLNSC